MKTITVEISQLSGPALDWAVATAVGKQPEMFDECCGHGVGEPPECCCDPVIATEVDQDRWSPSTDWSQGGPLIEKYRVWIASTCTRGSEWDATVTARTFVDAVGPTPLIAACRAIVAAVLGDEVDVPSELVEASDA